MVERIDPGPSRSLWTRIAHAAVRLRGDFALVLLDVVLTAFTYLLLFALRFDFSVPGHYWDNFQIFLPVACVVSVGSMWAWGCYGRTWRHASIDEALRLLAAGATTGFILVLSFMWGSERVPLTVVVVGPVIATFLCGMVRFQQRLFAFRRNSYRSTGVRVAVVGAGANGAAALREMQQSPVLGLVPVVAVDDDPGLWNRSMHGVPVTGSVDDLPRIVAEHDVHLVLLAMPSAPRRVVQCVADTAEAAHIPVRVLRESSSWVHGMPRLREMSDLNIEDLLGRRQVDLDLEPVRKLLHGRRVLVTGGGGWIGSEIARQVAGFGPSQLVLLDHDETHLHDTVYDLQGIAEPEVVLADIRDASAIDAVFRRARPEIVFHAAAHKHVPVLEDFACEAARTNVFGTLNVMDACSRVDVSQLVCISTDKAATPTSVMGASKWLAEQIVLERANRGGYRSVRFGNVLGSRGSVIPTFQKQIAAGGPVTVTDPRMTRYFMSTDEAVRLVLLCASLPGEHQVLALEMGEQVNIYALAERMIRLSGLRPHDDIEIKVTGLRPGERLAESLIGPAETSAAEHGALLHSIEPAALGPTRLTEGLELLERLTIDDDHVAAREVLLDLARPAARRFGSDPDNTLRAS
ncbi:MAG TPA: nucleoside-diphosphate sugar epimerase/dehydratase [Acidimicrobiia bacterium]|nr:nucleoside-diphosphate sugar epimerase/dehydratase [Acidimicrobiia bacterium]